MAAEQQRIDEDMVRYFVWAIWNFFSKTSNIDPDVEAPYLLKDFSHNDYTGVIGISGSQQGAVYFTMGRDLLIDLYNNHYAKSLGDFLDEGNREEFDALLADSAGEMANTVSGNVRNFLGGNFLISTPAVFRSPDTPLFLPKENLGIVFPIKWKEHLCHIVVSLKPSTEEQEK